MMVQALLLLPRLVVTPPARLVAVPSHCAAVRRFTAPGAHLGEGGGKPAHDAEQLLDTISTAQARGGSVQMCSATRDMEREVVLAAVQRDGSALEYASAELKADREVVLAAVQSNGHALQSASAELRADREVVMAAVQSNTMAFVHASAELKANRKVWPDVLQVARISAMTKTDWSAKRPGRERAASEPEELAASGEELAALTPYERIKCKELARLRAEEEEEEREAETYALQETIKSLEFDLRMKRQDKWFLVATLVLLLVGEIVWFNTGDPITTFAAGAAAGIATEIAAPIDGRGNLRR